MRLSLSLVVVLAACGVDVQIDQQTQDICATSFLDYQNFGAPFTANWCRGCHSAALPATMRQKAPATVNFDSVDEVRSWSTMIVAKAGGDPPTMPPAGGPSVEERAMLVEWVGCGAR